MPDVIYVQAVTVAQLLILVLIPLEIAFLKSRFKVQYDLRDTLANVGVSIGSIFFWGTLSWMLLSAVTLAYTHRLFNVPFTWWSFAIAFVLEDVRYYWWHRIGHRSRWFWASHGVHHSSQHFNMSTNLRQSWTSQFSGLILMNVPLAFIGFNPAATGLAFAINLLYQFWIHTEMIDRLPRWFEWLLNTPSHHRVHHASNARYLDANYAGVFMVWDRLFGSFVAEERSEPPRYGLVKNLGTYNPVRIALHEYVSIGRDCLQRGLTWRQRAAYFFAPPGWRHNGEHQTSDVLRAQGRSRRGESAASSSTHHRAEEMAATLPLANCAVARTCREVKE